MSKKTEKRMKKIAKGVSFGETIQDSAKQFMKDNDVSSMLLVAADGDGCAACVVECHGNESDYKLINRGTRAALKALKEEVEKAREEADDEDEDEDDSDEIEDLKYKLMKALRKKKALGKDGLPTKESLKKLERDMLREKRLFSAPEMMNVLAGEVLTDEEVKRLEKDYDDKEDDEDEDEDED